MMFLSVVIFPQYMSMLVALIVTELVTAAIGGLMTFQILSDLEERLSNKLKVDYGHDPASDIPFSHSLDFAQYKVSYQQSWLVWLHRSLYGMSSHSKTAYFFYYKFICDIFWIFLYNFYFDPSYV